MRALLRLEPSSKALNTALRRRERATSSSQGRSLSVEVVGANNAITGQYICIRNNLSTMSRLLHEKASSMYSRNGSNNVNEYSKRVNIRALEEQGSKNVNEYSKKVTVGR
jgi:hypothetical protein